MTLSTGSPLHSELILSLLLYRRLTPLIETELELTGDLSTLQMKVMAAPSRVWIRLAALEGRSQDQVL